MTDFLQTVGYWLLVFLTALLKALNWLTDPSPHTVILFFVIAAVWYLYDQTRKYGYFDAMGFGPAAAMFVFLHLAWLTSDLPYKTFLIGWIIPVAIGCILALGAGLLVRRYRPDLTDPYVWLDRKTNRAWVMSSGSNWFRNGPDAPWKRELKKEPTRPKYRDGYELLSSSEAVVHIEAVRSVMAARSKSVFRK